MMRHPIVFRPIAGLIAFAILVGVTSPCIGADIVILREGRQVSVKFTEKVQLKDVPEGGRVYAAVAEPVLTSSKEALAEGGKVTLEIGAVESPGMLGKGGKAEIKKIAAMAVDGSEVPLRPVFTRKGGGKRFLAIILIPVVFIGLFVKGHPATFDAGETITLEVAADSEVLVD